MLILQVFEVVKSLLIGNWETLALGINKLIPKGNLFSLTVVLTSLVIAM